MSRYRTSSAADRCNEVDAMISTGELSLRLVALNEKKRKADETSNALAQRTDLSEEERDEIDYQCMLAYFAADIRMHLLMRQWHGTSKS